MLSAAEETIQNHSMCTGTVNQIQLDMFTEGDSSLYLVAVAVVVASNCGGQLVGLCPPK